MSRGLKPKGGDQRSDSCYGEYARKVKVEEGGIVRLSGDFLLDHEDEILNLIKHEGRLAKEKNPAHRVSRIEKANGGIVAETTDHNLALHLGKALCRAYHGEHTYRFLKDEKFVEVVWKRD
jgi:hypothetical protein